jgi:hypothetical protein
LLSQVLLLILRSRIGHRRQRRHRGRVRGREDLGSAEFADIDGIDNFGRRFGIHRYIQLGIDVAGAGKQGWQIYSHSSTVGGSTRQRSLDLLTRTLVCGQFVNKLRPLVQISGGGRKLTAHHSLENPGELAAPLIVG